MLYWLLLLIVSATCASTLQVDRASNSVHVLLNGVELGANSNKHAARMQEYRDALAANLRHPQVHSVHVLWESAVPQDWLSTLPASSQAKVVSTAAAGRIKFQHAVQYANQHLQGKVVMLTNADIELTGDGFSAERLTPDALPLNTVLIPQRSEPKCVEGRPVSTCRCSDFVSTQQHKVMANCFDSYMFRAPLPAQLLADGALDFQLGGQWGSENIWIAELRGAGVSVYTPPCDMFGLMHNHCSQSRPNQMSQSESDDHIQRRWDRTCFHTFCLNTCVAESAPYSDRLSEMCKKPLCDQISEEYFTDAPDKPGYYGPTFPDDRWCNLDVDAVLRLQPVAPGQVGTMHLESSCTTEPCPDGWEVLPQLQCRAPASYAGPCNAISTFVPGTSGMAWHTADRRAWSFQCKAPWASCTIASRKAPLVVDILQPEELVDNLTEDSL